MCGLEKENVSAKYEVKVNRSWMQNTEYSLKTATIDIKI